jgi:hypothetical protein
MADSKLNLVCGLWGSCSEECSGYLLVPEPLDLCIVHASTTHCAPQSLYCCLTQYWSEILVFTGCFVRLKPYTLSIKVWSLSSRACGTDGLPVWDMTRIERSEVNLQHGRGRGWCVCSYEIFSTQWPWRTALLLWRLKRLVLPKRQCTSSRLRSVTSHKTHTFVAGGRGLCLALLMVNYALRVSLLKLGLMLGWEKRKTHVQFLSGNLLISLGSLCVRARIILNVTERYCMSKLDGTLWIYIACGVLHC